MTDNPHPVNPDTLLPLEYSAAAIDQIRDRVQKGLLAMPRARAGTGGLLFGEADGQRVRVLDSIEIPCSHASGPSFTLTATEVEQAKQMMEAGAPLRAVGWYCSKPRGTLMLSETDVALHRALFPKPWSVALVVQPSPDGSMLTKFFALDSAGEAIEIAGRQMDRMPPQLAGEMPMAKETHAGTAAVEVSPEPPPEQRAPAARELSRTMVEAGVPGSPNPAATIKPAINRRRSLGRIALGAGAVAATVFFVQHTWSPRPALALSSAESDGALVMRWNPEAVKGIKHASLSINDGGKVERLPLDRFQLDMGILRYEPKSERVTARLEAGDASAAALWVRPAPPPAVKPPDTKPTADQAPHNAAKTASGHRVRRKRPVR